MPSYTIEKSSKIVYGPFTAPTEAHLVEQLLAGEDLVSTRIQVKRMKESVQGKLPGLKMAGDQQ